MTSGSLWHSPASGPDAWVFVAARSFIAAINAGTDPGVIAALWSHADDAEVMIETIVGEIPLGGGAGVHSFAVVSLAGEPAPNGTERSVTAVVRGSAVVDVFSVGGARRFGAGSVEPWMLADFRSVTSVVLCGDETATAPLPRTDVTALPITAGVVRGERLLWSMRAIDFSDAVPVALETAGAPSTRQPDRSTAPGKSGSVEEASPILDPYLDPNLDPNMDLDATILTPRSAAQDAGTDTAAVPVPDDETIIVPRASGRRHAASATEPPLPPVARAREPLFRFTVAGSEPRPLESSTVFGRNPSAPRVIAGRTPVLVTVESPEALVSSSHVRIAPEGGAAVVTDLRSTNGTFVTPAEGRRRRLRAGESLVVLAGALIDIGDGNIIEIMSVDRPSEPLEPNVTIAKGPA